MDDRIERRYIALASLARRLTSARGWHEMASTVAQALGECEPATVRLWAMTADGLQEAAHAGDDEDLPQVSPLELSRAAKLSEPIEADGAVLVGVHADGATFGVLEVRGSGDHEVIEAAAALMGCRLGVLAGDSNDDMQLLPTAVSDASDASEVIADFARQAKRLLDHDRLSVYLLSHDGRAFERFAVATSRIVPGEGVLIPFEDVGLRHIVVTNRPIVSSDLGADPRLVGAEDRVIARAGFRGLLSVPLRHGGRPFGVLNFVSRRAGFYRQEDVPIAEQIADQIAAFVANLRLQRRTQAFIRQQACDRERTRLVRDLYQAVARAVSEITDETVAIEGGSGKNGSGPRENALRIRRIAQDGLADMRRAIVDLDPPGLDSGGLAEMIEQALERFREHTGTDARLKVKGDATQVPAGVARATYRVLQEALLNVRLHAEAGAVSVRLEVDQDLVLTVEDDGVGFDTRAATQAEGRLGLRHMRERTDALGGFLTVQSEQGAGTTIRLNVPSVREQGTLAAAAPAELNGAGSSESSLRVFVADPNALMRAGLCRLLESDGEMRVVGEGGSLDEVRGRLRQLHPAVVLLNTALANGDAERMIADVRKASPPSAVLAVSQGDLARDTELLEAGATGVLRMPIEQESLTHAVRAVSVGTRVLGGGADEATDNGRPETLTPRERSILALVAGGQTNAQIGRSLYLATKTVERQVATIVCKLGARNRAHAAAIAVSRRIVELPGEGS